MTIAALTRRKDRRLDRRPRTNVDRADLVRKLRRCATKDDFKQLATKEDLKRFVTRDELIIHFAAMQRQLESLDDKMDSVLRIVRTQYIHHDAILASKRSE
jgi:hypothetical protein